MTATTSTGDYPIGFRTLGGADWCKDLPGMIAWAKENRFACVDVGADLDKARAVLDAGLEVGSVDLPQFRRMIHPDADVRDEQVESNARFVQDAVGLGVRVFFVVMLPHEPERPRRENFSLMVDAYGRLASAIEGTGARLAIEGWPGPGAMGCTPADLRALFEAVPSSAMAINYDPSHLIRMRIDPLRFAREFAVRIAHVHAKDAEVDDERVYELGTEQPPTFPERIAFGGPTWRYTLPGHGVTRWTPTLRVLHDAGYRGRVSIEMEDGRFNADERAQKEALLLSRRFLEGV